jgi:L-asparagine transporter-like permease
MRNADIQTMQRANQFVRGLLLAALLCLAAQAYGQGCSLCKDATAGSAPKARQGFRRAILVLGIPAGAIFLAVLVIAKRIQPRENDEPFPPRPAIDSPAEDASL